MAETIADQVFARVEALMSEGASASRAAAFRRVADEMDRSVSATSSAYYAGARKVRDAAPSAEPAGRPRAGRGSSRQEASALYAEMLPLVEAGATVEQAARRFGGDEEDAEEIAAGFARWLARQEGAGGSVPDARLAELETELREVRDELARAREAISRARDALDSAAG